MPVLFDVYRVNHINERLGHSADDAALRHLATWPAVILRSGLRWPLGPP